MGNEYYSHGSLILPVSLFLVYQRFRNDKQLTWMPGQGSNWGLLMIAAGLALMLPITRLLHCNQLCPEVI